MTARRATPDDNDLLTSIVTHPEVWRWVSHDGVQPSIFNPADWTEHPTNFAVIVDGGCFLAMCLELGAYAIHTCFLPEHRGVNAVRQCRYALTYAFTAEPVEQMYTMVPDNNPNAGWLATVAGFRGTYRRKAVWASEGAMHDMQYFRMDIDDWIGAADGLAERGAEFHKLLDSAGQLDHGHDPVHDRYVGAAYAMVEAQNAKKAERVYGRWARQCGYLPFTVESSNPLRIDIGTCVLVVNDNGQLAIEEN